MIYRLLVLTMASLLPTINLCGQSGIVVTGQTIENGSGKISASVGQLDYRNAITITGNVSEGIQQSNSITVEVVELDTMNINVYPNPTEGNIYIDLSSIEESVQLMLLSADGKITLAETFINDMHSSISLANVAQGVYILKLIKGQRTKHTYRIIKQ